ncbi:ribonuclease VapC [Branchiibius hedensis]|uniref:Ribonuclease VapC n=1 Tax=Branchiibius hedensis TaxID=672460 RepID=A0A2Y8ZUI4_9MICO|nr:type II toxin-antitoxin system VapC family toxin [Branchiibius hedensis]PWJ26873.1 ribonuclease VapC [Branchiibius hedensis]SSA35684.1 Uncharacterized protein, contains PIN domain [Branchiibius hedensis]
MIVDTSALVAVLKAEAGWERIVATVEAAPSLLMSAATYVELGIVVDRRGGSAGTRRADNLLRSWRVEVTDVTVRQANIARAAYRDFGKGTGHPAQLNFGDCFAYALAVERDEPLLFVGDDFSHTDVRVAPL